MSEPFALILAIWGTKFGCAHVNSIVEDAYRLSPHLCATVLVTDQIRGGLDHRITQVPFPAPFNRTEFFGAGYRAKLAVFAPEVVPAGLRCVFLDLDTVVLGDLGRIADQVKDINDLFMLPPGGIGFSKLRILRDVIKRDGKFPVGNSSILAWHADAQPNLARTYAAQFANPDPRMNVDLHIDDVVIGWFGQGHLRGISNSNGVMFRREYLSRIPGWAKFKSHLPWVRRRRNKIAAVTLNGVNVKPELLATMIEGSIVRDGRGRYGPWTTNAMGPMLVKLKSVGQRILSETDKP